MNTGNQPAKNSRFSEFIRNASPEEKERVYLAVMERACARQREIIERAAALVEESPQSEDPDTTWVSRQE
ncbi:MAG: hypothetical protein M3R16_11405 [Pseudomonadota bacterium]|nr:hypothetical protein [Pseudomonadota bacterium]